MQECRHDAIKAENIRGSKVGGMEAAIERFSLKDRIEIRDLTDEWREPPTWMDFYLDLGEWMAEVAEEGRTVHVVLIPPTSRYAAVMIALGVVVSRTMIAPLTSTSPTEHFEFLRRTDAGTPVRYRKGNRTFKGELAGVRTFDGGDRIGVRIQGEKGGNLTDFIRVSDCRAVQVVADAGAWELPKNQSGTQLKTNMMLLKAIFGGAAEEVVAVSRLDCVLVGRIAATLEDLALFVRPVGSGLEGPLQQVLRVAEFGGIDGAFQARVIAGAKLPELTAVHGRQPVLIFNGAVSYLEAFGAVEAGSTIAIFDRADLQVEQAVDAQTAHFYAGSRDVVLPAWIELPPGLEVVAYEVSG